jgi:hypothetical protein
VGHSIEETRFLFQRLSRVDTLHVGHTTFNFTDIHAIWKYKHTDEQSHITHHALVFAILIYLHLNQYGSNTKSNSEFSLGVKYGEYILGKIRIFLILKTISKKEKGQYVK